MNLRPSINRVDLLERLAFHVEVVTSWEVDTGVIMTNGDDTYPQ